jgi:hypothetical protein
MRRLLVCAGLHSRPRGLEWLCQVVQAREPDGVVFAGGVLDEVRQHGARPAPAEGLTPADGRFLEQFFRVLGKLGVFSAVIPGPADVPLEDFLRLGMHAEIESPQVHVAHATLITRADVAVCGVGGRLWESRANGRGGYSRTLAEYHLRPLWTAPKPHRILLLPAPPPGPLGGEQGSPLVGQLIDSFHPSLCVVCGPNERRGSERIAQTLVINPGHLAEGWAALLDWHCPRDEQVEFVNLRQTGRLGAAADIGVCD